MNKTKKNIKTQKPEEEESKVAYGYTRISTDMQREDGISLETQDKRIVEYCGYKGLELKKIYKDVISGKSLDRPELQELNRIVVEGDRIIVTDLTRLSRDTEQALKLLREWKERGVKLQCLNPDVDFSTPIGKMMYSMMLVVAEMERNKKDA